MASIVKIEIEGFKAFPEHFSLDLPEGKNLLMYGENGSGKSSIYYALHALLQSVFKTDHGAKYFTHSDEENLINIYRINDVIAGNFHPNIKLTFNDGDVWTLNLNGVLGSTEDKIKLLNRYAIFINHSYISRFHAARNSEEIDLWNVFYKDILPFYLPPQKSQFLAETYEDIVKKCQRWPMPRLIRNGRFLRQISTFNSDLEGLINQINRKVSDIYNKYFKNIDDNDLDIKLCFFADNDPENTNHDEHYLFYGNNRNGRRFKKQLHNPNIGICIKENNVEINKPQTYFNEAKLTAIALSVRFACLSQHPIDGAFLALDDMLISLDMSNRMKVIDYLLKKVLGKYKIYVFTHDRLFYHTYKRIIERNYDKSKWLFGGLYINDLVSPSEPNFKPDISTRLEDAHEAYAKHDYFRCGVLLRQMCEQKLKELLPESYRVKQDSQTLQTIEKNLDEQISSLEDFCTYEKIDFTPFVKLKSYKDLFLNSTAHNDITSPFYRNEIKACLKAIDELSKIEYKDIDCKRDISFQITDTHGVRHIIGIRMREKLKLLKHDLEQRISYFSKCEVRRDETDTETRTINEGYESIYTLCQHICEQYGIAPIDNPLTMLKDRDGYIHDKI